MSKQISATVLRPARLADIKMVRGMIEDAVIESPFYSDVMKAFELKRFNLAYIYALIAADPRYVLIIQTSKGENAGLFLSGPELGVLVNYWSFIAKPYRTGSLILRSMASFVAVWDEQNFHKTAAYVRCDNVQPQKILERVGYKKMTTLKNHIFGEDYFLYEYAFTRAETVYKLPVSYGLVGRIRAWASLLFH